MLRDVEEIERKMLETQIECRKILLPIDFVMQLFPLQGLADGHNNEYTVHRENVL